MKSFKMIASAMLVASAGLVGAVMADDSMPAVPATPAPVFELISAQPFVLQQPYTHAFIKGNMQVSAGYIVVLSVNPDLVFPRNSLMPVLYGGSTTGYPINFGHESGKVVAVLPSTLTQDGKVAMDLTQTPIWYGTPELPERVDAAKISGEKALASRAGIKPFSADQVAAALKTGGAQVSLQGQRELLAHVAPLIIQYSPQEKAQADSYLGKLAAEKQPTTPAKGK